MGNVFQSKPNRDCRYLRDSNAMLCGTGSLSDEEYVVVDNVEVSPNSKTERAGAIQIMELSKDAFHESESGGSDSDAWVVV